MFQKHICPLHSLSDDQILPLLLAMDPQTLLNCGRASPRLYRLVCSREVWRHLLKEVEVDFTKEQIDELVLFGRGLFGISGSPEMMAEVVKEAARRFSLLRSSEIFHLPLAIVARRRHTEVKMTIAIQSWGTPDTFQVDSIYLEELTKVAKAVGAKFTIWEIEDLGTRLA